MVLTYSFFAATLDSPVNLGGAFKHALMLAFPLVNSAVMAGIDLSDALIFPAILFAKREISTCFCVGRVGGVRAAPAAGVELPIPVINRLLCVSTGLVVGFSGVF